jgi:hypothetical protein
LTDFQSCGGSDQSSFATPAAFSAFERSSQAAARADSAEMVAGRAGMEQEDSDNNQSTTQVRALTY